MKEIFSFEEFFDEVGLLSGADSFESLDIEPDISGIFLKKRVEELRSFCFRNPEFHIVSCTKTKLLKNRFDPEGCVFYLAEGNPDPEIFFIDRMTDLEFLETIENILATHFPALKRRIFG